MVNLVRYLQGNPSCCKQGGNQDLIIKPSYHTGEPYSPSLPIRYLTPDSLWQPVDIIAGIRIIIGNSFFERFARNIFQGEIHTLATCLSSMSSQQCCPIKFGTVVNDEGMVIEVPCSGKDCAWFFKRRLFDQDYCTGTGQQPE